jgi:hypothetical protein
MALPCPLTLPGKAAAGDALGSREYGNRRVKILAKSSEAVRGHCYDCQFVSLPLQPVLRVLALPHPPWLCSIGRSPSQ